MFQHARALNATSETDAQNPLSVLSGTPPAAPLATATATPDREPSFFIVCRGGIYGEITRVGFQQISEMDKGIEIRGGVAVELHGKDHPFREKEIIRALSAALKTTGFIVEDRAPDFLAVPNPEKTVLFMRTDDPLVRTSAIMRAIPPMFRSLSDTQDDDLHGAPHILKFKAATSPPQSANTKTAAEFVEQLRALPELAGVRGLPWLAIESHAIQALRSFSSKDGRFAKCLSTFDNSIGEDRELRKLSRSQLNIVRQNFSKLVEELLNIARNPAQIANAI